MIASKHGFITVTYISSTNLSIINDLAGCRRQCLHCSREIAVIVQYTITIVYTACTLKERKDMTAKVLGLTNLMLETRYTVF